MGTLRLNVALADVGRVMERVTRIDKQMLEAQTPAAGAMAEETLKYMEARIREPKSGIQHRGYPRPSGVEGGYPAYQWGGLVGSFMITTTRGGNATLSVGRSLTRNYALRLEYGYTRGGKKFPFIRPSVEAMTPQYRLIVLEAARKYLNG
jgi:hypothetical protein